MKDWVKVWRPHPSSEFDRTLSAPAKSLYRGMIPLFDDDGVMLLPDHEHLYQAYGRRHGYTSNERRQLKRLFQELLKDGCISASRDEHGWVLTARNYAEWQSRDSHPRHHRSRSLMRRAPKTESARSHGGAKPPKSQSRAKRREGGEERASSASPQKPGRRGEAASGQAVVGPAAGSKTLPGGDHPSGRASVGAHAHAHVPAREEKRAPAHPRVVGSTGALDHHPLKNPRVPPLPHPDQLAVTTPSAPMLGPDPERWLYEMRDAYDKARGRYYPHDGEYGGWRRGVANSKPAKTMERGAETMVEKRIPPVPWAHWYVRKHSTFPTGGRPPTPQVVYSPKTIGKWRHEFREAMAAAFGKRRSHGPVAQRFLQRYNAMRMALCRLPGDATQADVDAVVEHHWPGDLYDRGLEAVAREVAQAQQRIEDAIECGEFVWGRPDNHLGSA